MADLLTNTTKAETIANNSVKVFRERYLTPAAEACYWRTLWRAYAKVSDSAELWKTKSDGTRIKRGLRYETFVLLPSEEILDFSYNQ